jgi:hypothetical protein
LHCAPGSAGAQFILGQFERKPLAGKQIMGCTEPCNEKAQRHGADPLSSQGLPPDLSAGIKQKGYP